MANLLTRPSIRSIVKTVKNRAERGWSFVWWSRGDWYHGRREKVRGGVCSYVLRTWGRRILARLKDKADNRYKFAIDGRLFAKEWDVVCWHDGQGDVWHYQNHSWWAPRRIKSDDKHLWSGCRPGGLMSLEKAAAASCVEDWDEYDEFCSKAHQGWRCACRWMCWESFCC